MQHYVNGALSNTAVAVKSSSGRVFGFSIYNPNTTDAYVQFFGAGASVSVGTTAPIATFFIPPLTVRVESFEQQAHDDESGFDCSSGIRIAATTTATGSTAPASALVVERLEYR